MDQTTLNVKGMTCSHCKMAVTQALENVDGVHQVKVDLDHGKVEVTYDAGKATVSQMKEAVKEQGYDVV